MDIHILLAQNMEIVDHLLKHAMDMHHMVLNWLGNVLVMHLSVDMMLLGLIHLLGVNLIVQNI